MYLYNKNIHMKKEEWRPIVGYEGLYEVSNKGRVKSLAKSWLNGRKNSNVFTKNETILKKYIQKNGYERIVLRSNNTKKDLLVHRVVAITFIPNPNNKPAVNHIDGNKLNNNIYNLEWVTYKENSKHSFITGLNKGPVGELCGTSKLTENQIIDIRSKYSKGNFLQKELAEEYGVTRQAISKIILKNRWKHI
jgi:hypothetical protein